MTEENEDLRSQLSEEFDRLQDVDDAEIEKQIERDEKGRFKAKEEKEPEVTETPEKAEQPEENTAVEETPAQEITDQGTATVAEPAPQPLSPPERWSAEWKAKFTALPREAQQVLLDREGEYDKGFTQKSQESADLRRKLEPLDEVITPYRQAWAMQGMTEAQAIRQLLAYSDFANRDPVGFIRQIAQANRVDLATLVEQPSQVLPPEIAPLVTEIQSLKQQLQNQQQASQQQQQQAALAAIEAFKKDKPHFDECEADIEAEIPVIRRMKPYASHLEVLQEAYDRATWTNPAVRQRLLDSQRAEAEAKAKEAEVKKAQEAAQAAKAAKKAAGTVVVNKPSIGGGKVASLSVRETLSKAYDELHGAA